ncbi:QsdR family transcriptional regulator [Streptomyces sp. YIM 98790]|uniref:QsdR family transcriptional regulator n=1 Tax=Streptomyces sp. YIM 98790 TaxID=2689077 RepID=UPI00140B965D|nr:QsdR family transcriptional regulator [Streptomyces sp. YIM 98790]
MGRAAEPRRVVSREAVVRGAAGFFLRHGTVDMAALAPELAISRATLYRIAGSRDALLAEALWRLGEATLAHARRRRTAPGVEGVLEITRRFARELEGAEPFRSFLRAEPATALRLLTAGRVHRRAVRAQQDILAGAAAGAAAGGHGPAREAAPPWAGAAPADLGPLAYLYIRVVESGLYAELLVGRRMEFALTERAARALLLHAG